MPVPASTVQVLPEILLDSCDEIDIALNMGTGACLVLFGLELTRFIESNLSGLSSLGNMTLSGNVTPMNIDNTPEIERLEFGIWSGVQQGVDFNGCFNVCEHQECIIDEVCTP